MFESSEGKKPADMRTKLPCEYRNNEAPTVNPPGTQGVIGLPAAAIPGESGDGSVTLTLGE